MTVDIPSSHAQTDRIAAELAALGEPALEPGEIGQVDGPDIALVQGLVDVAEHVRATPDLRVLSEIEQRRAWRRVVERLDESGPAGGRPRAPRGLVPALAALAAAAAVMIMPRIAPPPPGQSPELDGLSRAARSGLEALGDTTPGARAREMSARLEGGSR